MDYDRYGLDGQPIYPRPGHFDHVTGQQLPTFRGEGQAGRSPLTMTLAAFMVIAGAALAYMANVFG